MALYCVTVTSVTVSNFSCSHYYIKKDAVIVTIMQSVTVTIFQRPEGVTLTDQVCNWFH